MLDFSMESKITKEYLLEKNSEETYMSYYLGIPVKKGLFISPLRDDKHKTCSFFRGKSGNLYFKDFATGECLTFEGVVMAINKCSYQQALRIIAKDFGYIKGSIPTKPIKKQPKFESNKQTFIQVEVKNFSDAELKWWLSFGISKPFVILKIISGLTSQSSPILSSNLLYNSLYKRQNFINSSYFLFI